ncbi:MAG: electron transfer flavoprotein subunit alpha/FixB family protein [Thermoplasmata archaeon]|nr:electron transfer flavoprotein subunit alpha/FixB family protein [Thermoplasmata archaeon]
MRQGRADRFGRAVAGRLAAHEGWGLTGDATGIERGADGRPLYRKPAFGGRWIAEIATRSGPAVATVRPGAFPPGSRAVREPPPVESIALSPHPPRVRAIGGGVERDAGWGEPLSAGLVFVAGQGVEGPEGVFAVRDAARSLGGALGATRRVVDLGWAPRQVQVGLTGIAPEPKVAVLVGVSGSTNHMVGLRRARAIVAVNHDATAPVFQRADIGLVGDWKDLLPLLRDALSATLPVILDRAP